MSVYHTWSSSWPVLVLWSSNQKTLHISIP